MDLGDITQPGVSIWVFTQSVSGKNNLMDDTRRAESQTFDFIEANRRYLTSEPEWISVHFAEEKSEPKIVPYLTGSISAF